MLLRNWTTKTSLFSPPHLTNAPALPVKTGNFEVVSFQSDAECLFSHS